MSLETKKTGSVVHSLEFWYSLFSVVFLHPAEGLVLWEESWHRMAALFSTRHDKMKALRRTKSCLSGQKQNECHVTRSDTYPLRFEGRYQIHLTSLINIISLKNNKKKHDTALAVQYSSTANRDRNKQNISNSISWVVSLFFGRGKK